MNLVSALILGPMAVGVVLALLKPDRLRGFLVAVAVAAVSCGVIALALRPLDGLLPGNPFNQHGMNLAMLGAELAMGAYILYVGIRSRRPLVIGLMLAQGAVMAWLEVTSAASLESAHTMFVDKFSVIMALINGLVGGGICLYALGYMRGYHAESHPEVRDRRPLFFAVLFLFMGAMFGIVFANSLPWLFFFWEITTLCSFLLIGYTQTEEARRNALKALTMNLAGGVAFAVAIAWVARRAGTVELQALIASKSAVALLPAALLCFAGITKSAQLPFSGWLLGAMVAPTPVSALLHSSTMVKAGVYLVLRMSPLVIGSTVGLMVALVGAVTFLVGSLAAITTSDAKKVLAWSTVANLGLIVLCGGIGTHEAVWAGVLLIIFHAISKCLLFLCVGVVEHKQHSRDIESMSGLILSMPRTAIMMLIGMAGMFLAPFGMLISKWAVLKAVIDAAPSLTVFIVFGSAATLFFWVKWMGKLIEVVRPQERAVKEFGLGEAIALYSLAVGTFLTCLLFPLISTQLIEPYVLSVYGQSASMSPGNVVIMLIMMVMIMLFPLSFIHYGRGVKVMDAYLGGANVQSSTRFLGSANEVQSVSMSNYYLRDFLNEGWLARWGVICAWVLLAVMVAAGLPLRQGGVPTAVPAVPAQERVLQPAEPGGGPAQAHLAAPRTNQKAGNI
ncbi:MAG TPA: proton-conducting transporter membrane subunit [Clostridia bacterium]|nr:proton-conducting transporter membrane subunit [Clostridia bacterium]